MCMVAIGGEGLLILITLTKEETATLISGLISAVNQFLSYSLAKGIGVWCYICSKAVDSWFSAVLGILFEK